MYWNESLLKHIVGYLGNNVLKIDNATLTKSKMLYARVLVDMTLADGNFLRSFIFLMSMINLSHSVYSMIGLLHGAPQLVHVIDNLMRANSYFRKDPTMIIPNPEVSSSTQENQPLQFFEVTPRIDPHY